MSIAAMLCAFMEGLTHKAPHDRPIGLRQVRHVPDDELLNQLAQPLYAPASFSVKAHASLPVPQIRPQLQFTPKSLSKAAPAFVRIPATTHPGYLQQARF